MRSVCATWCRCDIQPSINHALPDAHARAAKPPQRMQTHTHQANTRVAEHAGRSKASGVGGGHKLPSATISATAQSLRSILQHTVARLHMRGPLPRLTTTAGALRRLHALGDQLGRSNYYTISLFTATRAHVYTDPDNPDAHAAKAS